MPNIPVSDIIRVTPSVIGGGGSALDMIGLVMTHSTRIPIGTVQSFSSVDDVAALFGSSDVHVSLASNYFLGFDNSNVKPGRLLMAQYPSSAVGAYVRGGRMGLTVAQMQALSSAMTFSLDTVSKTLTSAFNGATVSASDYANILAQDYALANGSDGYGAVVTGSVASGVLTVTVVTSGTLSVGMTIGGTGFPTNGASITGLLTGTGGVGTYSVNIPSGSIASTTVSGRLPVITYDTVTGSFVLQSRTAGASSLLTFPTGALATSLGLTAALGAVYSAGSVATDPLTAMDAVKAITTDWAFFTTGFEPTTSDKVLFAQWTNTQVNRYGYVCWDTDVQAATQNSTTSAGYLIDLAAYSGTEMIYTPTTSTNRQGAVAWFQLGAIASIDFTELNGRTTMAFRHQAGLVPEITNQTVADTLSTNGYNFYGIFATANDTFNWFQQGQISGAFQWVDSYVNQIWLNNAIQLAEASLLDAMKSIPYNRIGYALIEAAAADPILAAVNFGAIRPGVSLSQAQIAEINFSAGKAIDATLTQRGWYFQVLDATAQVRAARGSPPATLWYMDGESVQKLSIASVEVQ